MWTNTPFDNIRYHSGGTSVYRQNKGNNYGSELQEIAEMIKSPIKQTQFAFNREKQTRSKITRIKRRVVLIWSIFSAFSSFLLLLVPFLAICYFQLSLKNTDFPLPIFQHIDKFIIIISSYFAHIKINTDLDSF